jgi:hypothetical protein
MKFVDFRMYTMNAARSESVAGSSGYPKTGTNTRVRKEFGLLKEILIDMVRY